MERISSQPSPLCFVLQLWIEDQNIHAFGSAVYGIDAFSSNATSEEDEVS
jgi:hypothetical protein